MKFVLFIIVSCTLLTATSLAATRIVVMSPAVSPILQQMGLASSVVGTTYNDELFPEATRVGSHLSPNIELIKALQPGLLIVGSERAFPNALAERFDTDLFRYDPRDLEEILASVRQLGERLDRRRETETMIDRARTKLSSVTPLSEPVSAVFEISQRPLKVAGQHNIVTSMIEAAGGRNLVTVEAKHVLLSPEKVLVLNPRVYIYQNGPMNKNPRHPRQRSVFTHLNSLVIEVDQLQFTRPGLNTFDAVLELHQVFIRSTAQADRSSID